MHTLIRGTDLMSGGELGITSHILNLTKCILCQTKSKDNTVYLKF